VTLGHDNDGKGFVQIGTVAQVSDDLDIAEGSLPPHSVTPADLFRRSGNYMSHEIYAGIVEERSIDRVRTTVQEGGDLVEGEFVLLTAPGKPIRSIPDERAIWAPLEVALGEDWHVVEE
jgi:hypothetical protein